MFDSGVSINILPPVESLPRQNALPSGTPSSVRQHTLKNAITCSGIGLHSGAKVTMTLRPGPVNGGIVFRRVDIAGQGAVIPARWSSVSDTRLNTCVANAAGADVRTIEHLMAALAGTGIDNAIIDINGPETPVMDGSAFPFVFLIECAGIAEQDAPRMAIKVRKRVSVVDGDKMVAFFPSSFPSLRVAIDFPVSAIRRQECFFVPNGDTFRRELSRARTFGFEQEVASLYAAGLARGGSLDNAVVISSDGERVLNEDGLRYEDEFVRHKALDALGDLYLAGLPVIGAYHGVCPGHGLNNRLLRTFFADASAWEIVPFETVAISPVAVGDHASCLALASA